MGSNPVESPEFFRFMRQLLKLSSKCEDHIFIRDQISNEDMIDQIAALGIFLDRKSHCHTGNQSWLSSKYPFVS